LGFSATIGDITSYEDSFPDDKFSRSSPISYGDTGDNVDAKGVVSLALTTTYVMFSTLSHLSRFSILAIALDMISFSRCNLLIYFVNEGPRAWRETKESRSTKT
jgi:hypothetical protein